MSDQPITKLHVSTSDDEEDILRAQGFSFINADLNSGIKGAKRVLLWYKKECGEKPITRIQTSFHPDTKKGLVNAGFQYISRDVNAGTTTGDHVFFWYLCGDTSEDVPIVELTVTLSVDEEPELMKNGYECLSCDLNHNAGGNWIYLWVKRKEPTYIFDITVTDSITHDKSLYEQGFTRVDENTNNDTVFIWYRRSKDESKALSDLDVSTNLQEAFNLQQKGFKQVPINLSKGTTGQESFLWYLKDGCKKIQGLNLLVNPTAQLEYQKAGVVVIDKNLNPSRPKRIAYYAA